MNNEIYIFKSNGNYLGFIISDFIFSRDGVYLGWLEGKFAWDTNGKFRGEIFEVGGYKHIVINKFAMPPVPRTPKSIPSVPVIPPPPPNIPAIVLPLGYMDAFN